MRGWKVIRLEGFKRVRRCIHVAIILLLLTMFLVGMVPGWVRAEEAVTHSTVVTRDIYHLHVGNETERGGCYQEAVQHQHRGNAGEEGGCHQMPIYHLHTGNETEGGGCYAEKVYHIHSGSVAEGGGCYQSPVKHMHSGSAPAGGGCYSVPIFHVHTGNEISGGGCYEPVYHVHTSDCYKAETCKMEYKGDLEVIRTENRYCFHHGNTQHAEIKGSYEHSACGAGTRSETHFMCWTCQIFNKSHEYQKLACTKGDKTIEGWHLACSKGKETVESWQLGCKKTTDTIEAYTTSCKKTEQTIDSYKRSCGKDERSIDAYAINCGYMEGATEYYKRSCKKEQGVPYGRISITNYDNNWTSGSQVLKAFYEELNNKGTEGIGEQFLELKKPEICWEQGREGDQIEVTENGTYTAILQVTNKDIDEKQLRLSIKVSTIDKTAPAIEKVSYNKEGKMVRISARDLQPDGSLGSGLIGDAYSYDGGRTWRQENYKKIEAEGNYRLLVRDRCGNIAERDLIVEKEAQKEEQQSKPEEPVIEKERTENRDKNKDKNSSKGGESSKPPAPALITNKKEDESLSIKSSGTKTTQKKKNSVKADRKKTKKTEGMILREEEPKYQVRKETKKQAPLLSVPETKEISVHNVRGGSGRVKVIKAAAFTIGSVIGAAGVLWLVYLLFGTIRIYHSDGEGKHHYAGSGIVRKKGDVFELAIPLMIVEQSVTGQYNLKPGRLFIGRNKGKELAVVIGGRRLSVWIDEEIPIRE